MIATAVPHLGLGLVLMVLRREFRLAGVRAERQVWMKGRACLIHGRLFASEGRMDMSEKKKSIEISGRIAKVINAELADGLKDKRTWAETVSYFIDFAGVEVEEMTRLAAKTAVIAIAARNRDSRESARKLNGTTVKWTEFIAEKRTKAPATAEQVGELLVKKLESGGVEDIEAMIAKLEALKAAKSETVEAEESIEESVEEETSN